MKDLGYIPCHTANKGPTRNTSDIEYIVMHYTANKGDTPLGNAKYFTQVHRDKSGKVIKASAHKFVDEVSVVKTVKDSDVAYHCGTTIYKHPKCRNHNSVGIEMCSDYFGGEYVITEATLLNAVEVCKQYMRAYAIPACNVLRHYDVTGKNCPAPWVKHPEQWERFKKLIKEV